MAPGPLKGTLAELAANPDLLPDEETLLAWMQMAGMKLDGASPDTNEQAVDPVDGFLMEDEDDADDYFQDQEEDQ